MLPFHDGAWLTLNDAGQVIDEVADLIRAQLGNPLRIDPDPDDARTLDSNDLGHAGHLVRTEWERKPLAEADTTLGNP